MKRTIVGLILLLSLTGCTGWLTRPHSVQEAVALMKEQNARGCVYMRGSARPYADVSLLVVGTWGEAPPPYAECFKDLPAGIP